MDTEPFCSQANLLPGASRPIGPWPISSVALSLPGQFIPRNIRSVARSLPGMTVLGNFHCLICLLCVKFIENFHKVLSSYCHVYAVGLHVKTQINKLTQ